VDKSTLSSTQVLFPGWSLRGTIPYQCGECVGAGLFTHQEWDGPLAEIPLISIVDDNDLSRAAIENLVTSLGFSTRTFASAESFLRSSSIAETRCLLLDVQMPQMSGLELQDHLAQSGVDIPIIFVTAYPDETSKARALNGGAICFLHKSLDLNGPRLADCLHAALSKREGPAPAG
jgi:FixJ family two-component response regulator